METRHLLSITVDTLVDENDGINTGGVSLRDALAYAYSQSGPDIIEFDPALSGGTIELTNEQLILDSDVEIVGPGANLLTVDAQGDSRVFVVNSGVEATIAGVTITGGGSVNDGAGIYNYGDLQLHSVRVTNNKTNQLSISVVGNDQGGGIISAHGSLRIYKSEIDSNEARWNAGIAFYANSADDTLEIVNSTIHSNFARDVDGWYALGGLGLSSTTTAASFRITNSTISGNKASGSAGLAVNANVHVDIINSTITKNEAMSWLGGGIVVDGANALATLHNTIVADNIDPMWGGWHSDVAGAYHAGSSHNLIGNPGSTNFQNGVDGNLVGSISTPLDPGLAPLGNYGGSTKTHALWNGSPALDAGDDEQALNAFEMPLMFDQRGHLRPFDLPDVANTGNGSVDIGAFEAGNPAELTVNTFDDELDDIHDPNFDSSDLSLREALAKAAIGAGNYTIRLDALAGQINLGLGELVIEKGDIGAIVIVGPSADQLTIDAQGGSRVFRVDESVTATLRDIRITGGEVNGYGGGIFSHGNLTIDRCQIDWNAITFPNGDGGGIYQLAYSGASLTIIDSTIANNTGAQYGGGVMTFAPTSIINSTISNNEADEGAGIALAGADSQIINSTIAFNAIDNSTQIGPAGVMTFDNEIVVHNSIIARNFAAADIVGTISPSSSHNLIGYDPFESFPTGNDNQIGYVSPYDPWPQLAPLGDYGGPTQTHALLPNSPAIDAGDDSIALAHDLIFDQIGEGFDRILGDHVDIGASESHIVIKPSVGIAIFGTSLDDEITLTDSGVTIDRIGTFALNTTSANEVVVFAGSGNDDVSAASLSRAVVLFGGNGDDDLVGGTGDDKLHGGPGADNIDGRAGNNTIKTGDIFDFKPERITFAAGGLGGLLPNPSLSPYGAGGNDPIEIGQSQFFVAWSVLPGNFYDPQTLSLVADQIGIVQIAKQIVDIEGLGSIWEWQVNTDWIADTVSPLSNNPLPVGSVDELIYPYRADDFDADWPNNDTSLMLFDLPLIGNYLAMEDYPGGPTLSGPYRNLYLRQEFETYVIAIEGPEGIQLDTEIQNWTQWTQVVTTIESATVYGGVKWFHDYKWNEGTGTYSKQRQITDTTGEPSDNFEKVLHDVFDYWLGKPS